MSQPPFEPRDLHRVPLAALTIPPPCSGYSRASSPHAQRASGNDQPGRGEQPQEVLLALHPLRAPAQLAPEGRKVISLLATPSPILPNPASAITAAIALGVSQNRRTTACSCPTTRRGPTKLGHTHRPRCPCPLRCLFDPFCRLQSPVEGFLGLFHPSHLGSSLPRSPLRPMSTSPPTHPSGVPAAPRPAPQRRRPTAAAKRPTGFPQRASGAHTWKTTSARLRMTPATMQLTL
jgi:hypothetical protein